MKIHNLAIVCLVAILVVYCGITLFTSVYVAVNAKEIGLSGLSLFSKNPATRLGVVALGETIDDPRPH